MRRIVRTLAVSALLFAPASVAQAQVTFGIRIGEPPPARAYRVPNRPSPDYVWVEGYQYPQGSHYKWHDGYWTRPPYQGAYWAEPYYYGGHYYPGQWEGSRPNFAHNHSWDRGKQRDDGRDSHGNGNHSNNRNNGQH